MKRIRTKKSKKGFTLLEVMLSVAILVIGSTMMLNGFMSTMNYSHNTSVFSRTASTNYSTAIKKVSGYSAQGLLAYKTIEDPTLDASGNPNYRIAFSQPVAGVTIDSIGVNIYSEKDGANDTNSNKGVSAYDEHYNDTVDNTFSNNRTSFYYIPEVNKNASGGNKGEIRIFKNKSGQIYWKDTISGQKVKYIVS